MKRTELYGLDTVELIDVYGNAEEITGDRFAAGHIVDLLAGRADQGDTHAAEWLETSIYSS